MDRDELEMPCVSTSMPQDMLNTFRVDMENQKTLEAIANGEIKPVIEGLVTTHKKIGWCGGARVREG